MFQKCFEVVKRWSEGKGSSSVVVFKFFFKCAVVDIFHRAGFFVLFFPRSYFYVEEFLSCGLCQGSFLFVLVLDQSMR